VTVPAPFADARSETAPSLMLGILHQTV
jgi:hypothetical protein